MSLKEGFYSFKLLYMERVCYNARANNILVTESILKEKAQRFGGDLGVADFIYQNGWLQCFKNRHGITYTKYWVKMWPSTLSLFEMVGNRLWTTSIDYKNHDLKDMFNVNETGLFYRMLPDKSLSTAEATKGIKKERIVYKLKPFVIGKSKRPRCFCDFNVNLYAHYTAYKTWMKSAIFYDFLNNFNRKMSPRKKGLTYHGQCS